MVAIVWEPWLSIVFIGSTLKGENLLGWNIAYLFINSPKLNQFLKEEMFLLLIMQFLIEFKTFSMSNFKWPYDESSYTYLWKVGLEKN
jgi:hypothetical protein